MMATVTDVTTARAPGRPRRFDPETELQMILDAATALLKRNDYEEVSVGAILTESGLSTRSFYRHFTSKDELLIVLYQQNAEQAGHRLSARVATSSSPLHAVESWVEEMFSLAYDPRKARRVAIFDAPSARRAAGYDEAQRRGIKLLTDPLVEALERGRADGSFPLTSPALDARSISALVWDVIRWSPRRMPRAEAIAHVLRFSLPGLGVTPPR
jgi:AcrR family transcriptional regulator